MLRKGIGIDVGTTQISISSAEGGLLLKEPCVAAIEIDSEKVLDAGTPALQLAQRAPDRVKLLRPVWDAVVAHTDVFSALLRILLQRALGRTVIKPVAMVSIPCDLTEAQINATEDALLAAGVHQVHFLEAPLCAAIGVGFDFSSPRGQMLVHMGASRTEVAMLFLGDMVTYEVAHVGGDQFDSAIILYLRNRYQLYVGRRTAEQIKIRIGLVAGHDEPRTLDVRGRCMETGEQRTVTLSSKEMLGALREPLALVLDAVVSVVERSGDEMRADISKGGVVLTGGAILPGMDQFLADVMGLRTRIATNADTAAVEGAAKALAKIQ